MNLYYLKVNNFIQNFENLKVPFKKNFKISQNE